MMVSSDESRTLPEDVNSEKPVGAQVETVHTNERVPGHPSYYEKGGLRTYGDDADHDHEPPVLHLRDNFQNGRRRRRTRLMH